MAANKTARKLAKSQAIISSSSSPFPNPRKVEKYVTDTGEKMTKVDFGPPYQNAIVHSADRLMSAAQETPGILNVDLVWHFILPWLGNPQPEKDRFWRTFNQPTAEKQRKAGLYGVRFTNYTNEQQILGLVEEYKVLVGFAPIQENCSTAPLFQAINPDNEQRKLLIDEILKRLGCWVLASVLEDHEAPRRLHSLLKRGPVAEPQAGNQARKVLEKFAIELAEKWRLPTKKQLRLASGFGNDHEGKSGASREFRKLGLAGLPEG